MVKNPKSTQVIEHLVDSVIFSSNFMGWSLTSKQSTIKNIVNWVSKLSIKSCKQKDGLGSKEINLLWEKFKEAGGVKGLSVSELRTFVLTVFCFHTLCRFSCAKVIKTSHLDFHKKYFYIKICRSKTDQAGQGQNVILTKSKDLNDPHLLLCEYLSIVNPDGKEQPLFPPFKWDSSSRSWIPNESSILSYSAAYTSFKS